MLFKVFSVSIAIACLNIEWFENKRDVGTSGDGVDNTLYKIVSPFSVKIAQRGSKG